MRRRLQAVRVAEFSRDPLPVHVAVGHPRHALRRPHRLRLRRSVRTPRARRRARRRRSTTSGPARSSPALRQDLNGGGSKFCGDCPLKLPLKKDEAPPVRPLDAGPLPSRMYIECTAACNISCTEACCAPETGITRTRQAGMLDFDLFRRVVDEVGPSLGADRLLQLRRSVPAQARGRDVRVHQVALSAHLSLHEHQRPRAFRGSRRGGSCTPASTR